MLPEWAAKILESLGFPGVVIFVLLFVCSVLVAYIKSLQTKADKVYGYRLAERDTLNKTLIDTAKVLEDVLEQIEERNHLTEQQAELITKQALAFELLKVTILSQYDNIHEYNRATATVIASMADSIRTLTTMVVENRTIAKEHVLSVNACLNTLQTELVRAVNAGAKAQIDELRSQLGNVTRIEHRRRTP